MTTSATGSRRRPGGRGFTLVEVVLAIGLIALLFGVSVINFGSLIESVRNPDPLTRAYEAVREARLEVIRRQEPGAIRYQPAVDDEPPALLLSLSGRPPEGPGYPLPGEVEGIEFPANPAFASATQGRPGIIGPTGRLGFEGLEISLAGKSVINLLLDPATAARIPEKEGGDRP